MTGILAQAIVPTFAGVHLVLSVVTALVVGGLAWMVSRSGRRWLVIVTLATLAVIVLGASLGWGLYPASDVVVLVFGISAGVLLGKVFPYALWAFFVFLMALSILDVAQNLAFTGPPGPSATGVATNAHLIWVNFRVPLPSGHFNIGVVDLALIAAMTEHLRRHGAPVAIALAPGLLGLLLGELVVGVLPASAPNGIALRSSLIPYLTAGWVASVSVLRLAREKSL